MLGNAQFDLAITDPPFGDNVNYADLADFLCLAAGIPCENGMPACPRRLIFEAECTPKSLEAIDNKAEHPDDRLDYEKEPFIDLKHWPNY
ncbi:MAG: hypothetical protein U5R30_14425 [Deltaproteobacteria bacterium]|nr:hypothetical protein [Deltaproteobacteria bacterium]